MPVTGRVEQALPGALGAALDTAWEATMNGDTVPFGLDGGPQGGWFSGLHLTWHVQTTSYAMGRGSAPRFGGAHTSAPPPRSGALLAFSVSDLPYAVRGRVHFQNLYMHADGVHEVQNCNHGEGACTKTVEATGTLAFSGIVHVDGNGTCNAEVNSISATADPGDVHLTIAPRATGMGRSKIISAAQSIAAKSVVHAATSALQRFQSSGVSFTV